MIIPTLTNKLLRLYLSVMAVSSLLVALVAASIAWVAWRLTRNLIIQSPLDNIPGPRSSSYLRGSYTLHYLRLFS